MPVLETQRLLARLYTDPRLLEEFLSNRESFCARYADDGDFVSQVDPGQLEFFARSLRSKRAGEVKKLLSMTVRALGPKFEDEFLTYATTTVPTAEKKHIADAMAFCDHLINNRRAELDAVITESATFELSALRVRFDLKLQGESPVAAQAIPSCYPWLCLKRMRLALQSSRGEIDFSPRSSAKARVVLFARLPGLRGVWYW